MLSEQMRTISEQVYNKISNLPFDPTLQIAMCESGSENASRAFRFSIPQKDLDNLNPSEEPDFIKNVVEQLTSELIADLCMYTNRLMDSNRTGLYKFGKIEALRSADPDTFQPRVEFKIRAAYL